MSGIEPIIGSELGGSINPIGAIGATTARDRRRPGRLPIQNEHLIGLLRAPVADPTPDAVDPALPPLAGMVAEPAKSSLLPLVVAAAGFWGLLAAYIWLR